MPSNERSVLSIRLASAMKSLSSWIETHPSTALAVGNRFEIVGFARSERHLFAISREMDADVWDVDKDTIATGTVIDGVSLLFFFNRQPTGGK